MERSCFLLGFDDTVTEGHCLSEGCYDFLEWESTVLAVVGIEIIYIITFVRCQANDIKITG